MGYDNDTANSISVRGEKRLVTYKEWADLIQKNFERLYYVPADPSLDKDFAINPAMINRRGIYKDVYGTPKDREWSDYQVSGQRGMASASLSDAMVSLLVLATELTRDGNSVPLQLYPPHDRCSRAVHARTSHRRPPTRRRGAERPTGYEDPRPGRFAVPSRLR